MLVVLKRCFETVAEQHKKRNRQRSKPQCTLCTLFLVVFILLVVFIIRRDEVPTEMCSFVALNQIVAAGHFLLPLSEQVEVKRAQNFCVYPSTFPCERARFMLFFFFVRACTCAGEQVSVARRLSPSIAVPLQCVCMVVDSVDGNV